MIHLQHRCMLEGASVMCIKVCECLSVYVFVYFKEVIELKCIKVYIIYNIYIHILSIAIKAFNTHTAQKRPNLFFLKYNQSSLTPFLFILTFQIIQTKKI